MMMRSKTTTTTPAELESREIHLGVGKLSKLERDDLLHLLVEIQLTILDKLDQRKELESSISKKGMKVSARSGDRSVALTERGLDFAISEWFGSNPKGRISRESYEQHSDSRAIDPALSQSYFRRKPNFSNIQRQKRLEPSLRSHEGIGLDVAARAIIAEHLTSPGQLPESQHFDERKVIEAIVGFMRDNPAGPASFRRKFRERMALESERENGQSREFIENEIIPEINGAIKELDDFTSALNRKCKKAPDDVRAVLGVLEFFNRVRQEGPKVQNEMVGVWLRKQNNEAIRVVVGEFLAKRELKVSASK